MGNHHHVEQIPCPRLFCPGILKEQPEVYKTTFLCQLNQGIALEPRLFAVYGIIWHTCTNCPFKFVVEEHSRERLRQVKYLLERGSNTLCAALLANPADSNERLANHKEEDFHGC